MFENKNKINNNGKRITVKLNLLGVHERKEKTIEKIGATTQFVRSSGDFIYGKQNIHKGCFGIIPNHLDSFVSSNDIPSFKFYNSYNSLFFFYFLSRKNKYENLVFLMTGTGSKRLSVETFLKLEIITPSLPEQQKIANFFTLLDKRIELMEKKLQLYQLMKKHYLNLLFCDGNNLLPKLRFKGFSGEWEKKKLGDVVENKQYEQISYENLKKIAFTKGDIKLLPSSNEYNLFTSSKICKEKSIKIYNNSVFTLGKARYPNLKKINGNFVSSNNYIFCLKNSSNYCFEFIYYFIFKNCSSYYISSSLYPKFDFVKMINYLIFLPSLPEQQKIANFFTLLDKRIELMESNITNLKKQKKYFLNNLFN